jgi:hypothetical protein
MSDIHVLATFESQEAVLAGMRRAVSWIRLDEAQTLAALATEDSLKLVLGGWYSDAEIEKAIRVFHDYAERALERSGEEAHRG